MSRPAARQAAARRAVRLGQHAGRHLADDRRVLPRHLHGAGPDAVDGGGGASPRARLVARRFPQAVRRPGRRGRASLLRDLPPHPSRASAAAAGRRRRCWHTAGDAGCYVAVVSNKVGDNLRTELAHLGWQRWITRAVGAKDCQARQAGTRSRSIWRSTARELPLTRRYGWSETPRPTSNVPMRQGVCPFWSGARNNCPRSPAGTSAPPQGT